MWPPGPEKAGFTGFFGQPATTGGGMFTSTFGQQNKPAGFGFGTPEQKNTFLGAQQSPTTSIFNSSRNTDRALFRDSVAFDCQLTTVIKFNAVTGNDIVIRNGNEQSIITKYHSITCMKEYENKSFEELRFEDYTAYREALLRARQPSARFGVSTFGASPNTPSSFGQADANKQSIFGQSLFGWSSTFGQNSTGQQGTTGFGAPVFGASTSATAPLFGQADANKSAFGQAGVFGQTSRFTHNKCDKKLCELQQNNQKLEAKIQYLEQELQQLKIFVGKCSNPNATSELISTHTQTFPSQEQVALKPPFKTTHSPHKPKGQQHEDNIAQLSTRLNKQMVIIGTGSGDGQFSAAERRQWLHIERCDPKTTETDIIDHLKKHLEISDVKCFVLDQDEDVKSFKVGVKESVFNGLLDPGLWPAGTIVKEFHPRRQRRGPEHFHRDSPTNKLDK